MPFKRTEAGTDERRLAPAYPVAEAAHYLQMPEATLRSWVAGRYYQVDGRSKRSNPLIRMDDRQKRYLSFVNLVEAHVLAAIRRYGVKLSKVRRALDYVQREFQVHRPLVDQSFQTNGLELFVDRYGDLINVSREGQAAMKEIIGLYLARISGENRARC